MIATERRNFWTNPNDDRATTRIIAIHHAGATYTPGTAAEQIYAYHAKKWPDYHAAAYHDIIERFPDGSLRCSIMNPPNVIGAGVWGRNGDTFHICAATTFTDIPTSDWIDAIAERAAVALGRWPDALIKGHKELALPGHATSCPGARWDAWKPTLLQRIAVMQHPPARYRVRWSVPAFADWQLSAPAPLADAPHVYQAGDELLIDEVRGGVAHDASGLGFLPRALLEAL